MTKVCLSNCSICQSLALRTFSEQSVSNFLSFILHSSPILSTYSHHSQGSPLSRATRDTHSERTFICTATPAPAYQQVSCSCSNVKSASAPTTDALEQTMVWPAGGQHQPSAVVWQTAATPAQPQSISVWSACTASAGHPPPQSVSAGHLLHLRAPLLLLLTMRTSAPEYPSTMLSSGSGQQ